MRVRLAEIQLESGQFLEAATVAQHWFAADGQITEAAQAHAADAQRLLARAVYGGIVTESMVENRLRELLKGRTAGQLLIDAVQLNPNDPLLAIALAELYRRHDVARFFPAEQLQAFAEAQKTPAQVADDVVAQMVARNPDSAEAFVSSSLYKTRNGLPEPEADLQRSYELDPSRADTNFLLGLWQLAQAGPPVPAAETANPQRLERLQSAKSHFEASLKAAPENPQACQQLGEVHRQLGDNDRAVEIWKQGLALGGPESLQIYRSLIALLIDTDRDQAAKYLAEYRSATTQFARGSGRDPRLVASAYRAQTLLEGILRLKEGRYGQAIDTIQGVLTGETPDPTDRREACRLLGGIYQQLNATGQAAKYYQLGVDVAPDDVGMRRQLASLYATSGNFELAAAHYERLASDAAALPEDVFALASVLYQGQLAAPPGQRSWSRFDAALQRATAAGDAGALQQPWRVSMLAAAAEMARRQRPVSENPDDPEVAANGDGRAELIAELDRLAAGELSEPEQVRQLVELNLMLGRNEPLDGLLATFAAAQRGDCGGLPRSRRNRSAARRARTGPAAIDRRLEPRRRPRRAAATGAGDRAPQRSIGRVRRVAETAPATG